MDFPKARITVLQRLCSERGLTLWLDPEFPTMEVTAPDGFMFEPGLIGLVETWEPELGYNRTHAVAAMVERINDYKVLIPLDEQTAFNMGADNG